jgi:trans-aconitate 2-methyltransferase
MLFLRALASNRYDLAQAYGSQMHHAARETQTSGWDANLYLKYADERARPARDLLAQVPIADPRRVYDLGCGPGNSTKLLAARFPSAEIVGIDSSAEMLEQARRALPRISFERADLTGWRTPRPADLLFSNAALQWVPDHLHVLRTLVEALPCGGILAMQVPDNLGEPSQVLIREIAERGPWAERLAGAEAARQTIPAPAVYYELLAPLCRRFDLWHSVYQHVMSGAPAIVEWMTGTGLRPHLARLQANERQAFLAAYLERIAAAYPALADGRVLFPFPRLFVVAVKA